MATEDGIGLKSVHESELSELLCGLSISCITLFAFILSSLSTCCQCSTNGWWFANYYLVTTILSNIIGIAFFGTKIHENGWKTLELLGKHHALVTYLKGMGLLKS